MSDGYEVPLSYRGDRYVNACSDIDPYTIGPIVQKTSKILYLFVCVFSSHSFWTSSSLDVPAGVSDSAKKAEGSSIVDKPGEDEPLCARITGLNREVSKGKADV